VSIPALALLGLLGPIFGLTATPAAPAPAQPGAVAGAPASVDQVLARHVEALGGTAALTRHAARSAFGEWENVTRRVRFPIEVHAAAPDRWVELLDAPENDGVTGRGYDGTVGWSSNLTETGLRLLGGAELESRRREAVFHRPLRLRELYPQLELRGAEVLDGRRHQVVTATPPVGQPETWYFDDVSGLLVRRDLVLDGPFGPFPVSERYLDYREIDGVVLPFRIRSEAKVVTEIRLREIRHDAPLAASMFAPPGRSAGRSPRPQ
jgi:hypothetical protein